MNKVINGKKYNTDTAKMLAQIDNRLLPNDFGYESETLYLTKSGNYFLHGEGHVKSKYGEWRGNTRGWGEKIIPLSEEAAKNWCQENLIAEKYEFIFGELQGDRVKISADILPSTKKKIDKLRNDNNMSIGQLLDMLINKI